MSLNKKQVAAYVIENKEKHYRLAYSYVKDVDDALDIVQESIYKALSSLNTLREPQYIKTWFYRIVVNTSLDFLRRRSRLSIVDEGTLSRYDVGTVDQYRDFDLKDALNQLPENYRTIIILRYFEDLKITEVAEVLDKNVNTVKTQLYRALDLLRINLEKGGIYDEGEKT